MSKLFIKCGSCGRQPRIPLAAPSQRTTCRACGAPITLEVFPALFRETSRGRPGDALLTEDESSCFNHPDKKAEAPCEGCGRFLCGLCKIEFNGRHLCSICVEAEAKNPQAKNLQHEITHYDTVALTLAVFPLLIFFFVTFITAPIALYMIFLHFKAPAGPVPRGTWRWVSAAILAGLQIAGWAIGALFMAGGLL